MRETWNCTLISLLLSRGSYGGDTEKYHTASARSSPVHAIALLRGRHERPRGRAAEECDEVAPLHANLPIEDKAYQTAALCVTAKLAAQWQIRVNSRLRGVIKPCYPSKQTWRVRLPFLHLRRHRYRAYTW